MKASRSRPVLLVFPLVAAVVSGGARAEPASSVRPPVVRPPSFPLEPGRKAPVAIAPETYVEGKEEPPSRLEAEVGQAASDLGRWGVSFDVAWSYASVVSRHAFSTVSGARHVVRRDGATPLALGATLALRPPAGEMPISAFVSARGSLGRAEANAEGDTLARSRFNTQDFESLAGARAHLLSRSAPGDLRIGADLVFRYSTHATLAASAAAFDVDNRTVLGVMPRLEYRHAPGPNWAIEAAAGYGQSISGAGASGARLESYRRVAGGLEIVRYVAARDGIGVGFVYDRETATWSQSSPVAFSDPLESAATRLSLFWRRHL